MFNRYTTKVSMLHLTSTSACYTRVTTLVVRSSITTLLKMAMPID